MGETDPSQESNKRNSRKTVPRVVAVEPDRSLDRYMIEELKNKAKLSKEVPFEETDINLYKARAQVAGFRTSETRVRLWI